MLSSSPRFWSWYFITAIVTLISIQIEDLNRCLTFKNAHSLEKLCVVIYEESLWQAQTCEQLLPSLQAYKVKDATWGGLMESTASTHFQVTLCFIHAVLTCPLSASCSGYHACWVLPWLPTITPSGKVAKIKLDNLLLVMGHGVLPHYLDGLSWSRTWSCWLFGGMWKTLN